MTNNPVTDQERQKIIALHSHGVEVVFIAERLGRSVEVVSGYINRSNRNSKARAYVNAPKKFCAKEDAIIREQYAAIGAKAIGVRLGRTKNSVIGRANRLGVSAK